MNSPLFLANIASRLGLRFAPNGHSMPNLGVERGGAKIISSIATFQQMNTSADFEAEFAAPELIEGKSYLGDLLKKYTHTTAELLQQWDREKMLVTLGGDHSIAFISLSAVLEAYGEQNVAVLMFDSHADLHLPETSPSGNFHGMWLRPFFNGFSQYALNSKIITPQQLQFVGNLVIEEEEKIFLNEAGVRVHPSSETSESIISELLEWSSSFAHLHISFDIDVFAEAVVSATGTPNPDGFAVDEVIPILNALQNHPSISLDIVEFNPEKEGAMETLQIIEKVCESILPGRGQ